MFFGCADALGTRLGKCSAEDWLFLKTPSEFLSINILVVRNQIGKFDFVLLASGVVFEDPPCKNTLCGALGGTWEGGGDAVTL